MKWFKHYLDCQDDPGVRKLQDKFGFYQGYGMWFMTLEIVALEMGQTNDPVCTLPVSEWCRKLRINKLKLSSYTVLMELELKVNVFLNEDKLSLEIPNLLRIRDEYSKKSGQTPDKSPENVHDKSKEERVKTKDKHNITKEKINSENGKVLSFDDYRDFERRFELAIKIYPNSVNKKAAKKSFMAHTRTLGVDYYRELVFAIGCEIKTQKNAMMAGRNHYTPDASKFFEFGYRDYQEYFKAKKFPATYEKAIKL